MGVHVKMKLLNGFLCLLVEINEKYIKCVIYSITNKLRTPYHSLRRFVSCWNKMASRVDQMNKNKFCWLGDVLLLQYKLGTQYLKKTH